jgi:hypothetical protein
MVVLCLLINAPDTIGQQRVSFADSLESRAEIHKIIQTAPTTQELRYSAFKFGKASIRNFQKSIYVDTLHANKSKVKPPVLLALLGNVNWFGKVDQVNFELNRQDRISFEVVENKVSKSFISATRITIQRGNRIVSKPASISDYVADTSFLGGTIRFPMTTRLATFEIIFEAEGAGSINGMVILEQDTFLISPTDKAKKYAALGVEIRDTKVIGGMQLPDMHIGPAYIPMDSQLPELKKNMLQSILSLILFINENRGNGF